MAEVRVISIGTMAINELWGERQATRTGHATTTLIETPDARIIVDPGLPPTALRARLSERTTTAPDQITHVFLTSFSPETRRGISLFENARWLISNAEREAVGVPLAADLKRIVESGLLEKPEAEDKALVAAIESEISLLQKCQPAPDQLVPGVDLFPLPGVRRGLCGLLLPSPRGDLLITGDAVPTREHLEKGRVPTRAEDPEAAKASLLEAIEIADGFILGRDNYLPNPVRRSGVGFPGFNGIGVDQA